MTYYKILTRSYCSPLQGGEPIFDGRTPFTTPTVTLDTSWGLHPREVWVVEFKLVEVVP